MAGCGRLSSPPNIKILLVEDDEATLELLTLFLRRFYSVVACASGEGGLSALRSIPNIDIVITDLRMPGVSGYDVLRCASEYSRREGIAISTVVLTGHGTPADEQQARSLGVTNFQRKPIDLKQLRATIEFCYAARESQSQTDGQ